MFNQESVSTSTADLAAQAREAYDQKRTRECIALTKQLVQADPGNTEAQALESAIRADIQNDLHDARALLEQFGTQDETRKYRKAAEIILLKTLSLDPENQEASMLLQSARAVPVGSTAKPQKQSQPQPQKEKQREEEIPFVAASTLFENLNKKEKKKSGLKLPLGLLAVILLGGGLMRIVQGHRTTPDAFATPVAKAESAPSTNYQPRADTPVPALTPAVATSPAPV